MIYKIHQNYKYQGISYTIVKVDTSEDVDLHIHSDSKRVKLENKYGENIIFVTDDKGGLSGRHGGKKSPFNPHDLLNLQFHQVNI